MSLGLAGKSTPFLTCAPNGLVRFLGDSSERRLGRLPFWVWCSTFGTNMAVGQNPALGVRQGLVYLSICQGSILDPIFEPHPYGLKARERHLKMHDPSRRQSLRSFAVGSREFSQIVHSWQSLRFYSCAWCVEKNDAACSLLAENAPSQFAACRMRGPRQLGRHGLARPSAAVFAHSSWTVVPALRTRRVTVVSSGSDGGLLRGIPDGGCLNASGASADVLCTFACRQCHFGSICENDPGMWFKFCRCTMEGRFPARPKGESDF